MITCSYCGVGSGFYHKQRCEFYGMKFNAAASPVQGAASATKQEDIASRAMMSAHAFCPTDMAHPDRMRWMAKFILEKLASVDGWFGQGGTTPDNSGPINHAEAYELACAKRDKSNLARCYLDLRAAAVLAERAQAAQPVAGQAKAWPNLSSLIEYERNARGSDGIPPYRVETFYLASDVQALFATPAPEQEAAFKNDLGWGKCQVLKSEAAQVEREVPMCDSCDNEAMRLPDGSFGTCQDCVNFAAPVAQEAEQPQGDVMRPFGAPAGQQCIDPEAERALADPLYSKAVMIVRAVNRGSLSTLQRHLAIGYNRAARLLEAMEAAKVVSKIGPTGQRTVLAAALDQSAASGSREGRDGCTKSGASSTAFDDQYAEDQTGAANTDKGGEAK